MITLQPDALTLRQRRVAHYHDFLKTSAPPLPGSRALDTGASETSSTPPSAADHIAAEKFGRVGQTIQGHGHD